MKTNMYLIICAALMLGSCTKQPADECGSWARGADLSWLSEMEHDGMTFHAPDTDKDADCMQEVLKRTGSSLPMHWHFFLEKMK